MRSAVRTATLAGAVVVLTATSVAALAAGSHRAASLRPVGMVGRADTTCAAPAGLGGQKVDVLLTDMGSGAGMPMGGRMMMRVAPNTVSAGEVTLVAANRGTRTHEVLVLPLGATGVPGARSIGANDRIDESGSLGEASKSCGSGEGDGIAVGATSWVTLRLAPGRYELVCNLPGHYRRDMYAELDVTG